MREQYGRRLIEHGGAINGFLTQLNRFVDDDVLVVTLFNFETTFWREVNDGLSALALGEAYEPALRAAPVEVTPEQLTLYAGTYRRQPGSDLVLTVEEGILTVTATGEAAEPAEAQGEGLFFLPESAALMQVDLIDETTVRGIRIRQGVRSFPYRRL